METKKHCFDFRQYRTQQELPEQERLLIGKAAEACGSAYAPYSGFRVGAAVLLDDDEILTASNQESEVFPSGMCAERSGRWRSPRRRRRGSVPRAAHAGK